jgi:hypothetical protein
VTVHQQYDDIDDTDGDDANHPDIAPSHLRYGEEDETDDGWGVLDDGGSSEERDLLEDVLVHLAEGVQDPAQESLHGAHRRWIRRIARRLGEEESLLEWLR